MPPTDVVCDASALVELLVGDRRPEVAAALGGAVIHAPHLALFEVTQTLRNAERESFISPEEALDAVRDVLQLDVQYWPMYDLIDRVWGLRQNLTAYDASYVALAERLDAPLVTGDERLTRAPGPRCEFVVP